MTETWRRLSDADAMYLPMEAVLPGEFTPVVVSVFDQWFPDEEAVEHLAEVWMRLLPAARCRLVHDRFSPALPRWVDCPDFDPAQHMIELPTPGDGTLRAVLDWAADWGVVPMPEDRPPHRAVYFRDVIVDGVGGHMVSVGQSHHSMIDGQGAIRMAERFLQWGPDEPLPEMPPDVTVERITALERWREGWAVEGRKLAALLRRNGQRARWAAKHPRDARRRAGEIGRAFKRLGELSGTEPLAPAMARRSDRLHFEVLEVDIPAVKAGARNVGGSLNDGFLAAISLAVRAWHQQHGIEGEALRTVQAVNVRADDGSFRGNEIFGALLHVPIDDDDPARLVKRCHEASYEARHDRDIVDNMDRSMRVMNRLPPRVSALQTRRSMKSIDLLLSNLNGIPAGYYLGGARNIETFAFAGSGTPAVQMIMASTGERAKVGITTCPETIPDPEAFVRMLDEGFAAIAALAG